MSLNKFSSPEEVKAHYADMMDPTSAMMVHVDRFYPEFNPRGLTQLHLEKAIRTLSTKAMETL